MHSSFMLLFTFRVTGYLLKWVLLRWVRSTDPVRRTRSIVRFNDFPQRKKAPSPDQKGKQMANQKYTGNGRFRTYDKLVKLNTNRMTILSSFHCILLKVFNFRLFLQTPTGVLARVTFYSFSQSIIWSSTG